jgi:hypothetical protein
MNDAGGWLWLVIDVGAVAVLGVAIAYGVMKARRRGNNTVAPEYQEHHRKNVPGR